MDKVKLIEATFHKLSSDRRFIAYYLNQSALLQHKTEAALMMQLGCSPDNFYRLGLCQAPDPSRNDFTERLARIAGYANVSLIALNHLIKEVQQAETQAGRVELLPAFVRNWYPVKKIGRAIQSFTLPALFYRTGMSLVSLLFFLGVFTAKVDDSYGDFYNRHFFQYKDSVKKLCLQDKTQVKINLF